MIISALSIFLLVYGCINFKKGLMLSEIFLTFSYHSLVIRIGRLPLYSDFLLTTGYLVLFLLKRRNLKNTKRIFPFKIPFLLVIFSNIITCFFGIAGFSEEIKSALTNVMNVYVLSWILWKTLDNECDFRFLFKGITIVMFAASVYGIIEYAMTENPFLNYKVGLVEEGIALYNMNDFRGYRLTSFFEHPIGAGMAFGLYLVFTIYNWIRDKKSLPLRNLALLTSALSLICVFLTKMRSGILFTLLLCLSLINYNFFRKKKFYVLVIVVVIFIPILIVVMQQNIAVFASIFSKDAGELVGGSSLAMRITQVSAVFDVFKLSPIVGLGVNFRDFIWQVNAYGYESVWFEEAVIHGLVGLLSAVIMIYYMVFKIPKKYKSKPVRYFALAYWITRTCTSIPSFRTPLFFLTLFYFIKSSDIYKSKNSNLNAIEHENKISSTY